MLRRSSSSVARPSRISGCSSLASVPARSRARATTASTSNGTSRRGFTDSQLSVDRCRVYGVMVVDRPQSERLEVDVCRHIDRGEHLNEDRETEELEGVKCELVDHVRIA